MTNTCCNSLSKSPAFQGLQLMQSSECVYYIMSKRPITRSFSLGVKNYVTNSTV